MRTFLESRENIRRVAIQEFARCVGEVDADWVLDRYFALSGGMAKHEFLPVVLVLPPEIARKRLVSESRSPSRDNRQAAMKALGNMAYFDRIALLKPFLTDDDTVIRSGAQYLVEKLQNCKRPTEPLLQKTKSPRLYRRQFYLSQATMAGSSLRR